MKYVRTPLTQYFQNCFYTKNFDMVCQNNFSFLMGLGFCNISSIGHILSYLSTSWSSSPHSIRSANLYTISSWKYLQSFAVMHETIKCVQIFLTHLRNFPNCILSDHPRNELLENMLNSSLKVSWVVMMQYILVKTGYSSTVLPGTTLKC